MSVNRQQGSDLISNFRARLGKANSPETWLELAGPSLFFVRTLGHAEQQLVFALLLLQLVSVYEHLTTPLSKLEDLGDVREWNDDLNRLHTRAEEICNLFLKLSGSDASNVQSYTSSFLSLRQYLQIKHPRTAPTSSYSRQITATLCILRDVIGNHVKRLEMRTRSERQAPRKAYHVSAKPTAAVLPTVSTHTTSATTLSRASQQTTLPDSQSLRLRRRVSVHRKPTQQPTNTTTYSQQDSERVVTPMASAKGATPVASATPNPHKTTKLVSKHKGSTPKPSRHRWLPAPIARWLASKQSRDWTGLSKHGYHV